jgi:hypothetical protein
MPPSATPIAIKLLCERREYEKQPHADGHGKEELHSVIVPGHHTTERKPNHRCRNAGQCLQPSTSPNASEVSGVARPLRCFRGSVRCGWLGGQVSAGCRAGGASVALDGYGCAGLVCGAGSVESRGRRVSIGLDAASLSSLSAGIGAKSLIQKSHSLV